MIPRRLRVLFPLALASFAFVLGCSDSGDDAMDDGPGDAPRRERTAARDAGERDGAPASAEPRPIDPSTLGTIRGIVRFEGEPPRRKELAMGNEPACQHATPPRTEKVVVEDGKLQGVFVYVRRGHEGWIPPAAPAEPEELDQHGCLYVPHVLAVQTGQPLHVKNSDETTHNVNLDARRNGQTGNFTQGRNQEDLVFVFERREHGIPFKCDIHPWMGAVVHVQDHPWFAVSGPDGRFEIRGVPPGSYSLEAIQEELGKQRVDVVVTANGTAEASFTFED